MSSRRHANQGQSAGIPEASCHSLYYNQPPSQSRRLTPYSMREYTLVILCASAKLMIMSGQQFRTQN
jgi:hypothetical protein